MAARLMLISVERFVSDKNSTIGLLRLDDKFQCFTCEDEFREEKVANETRIPAGLYDVKVRAEGGMHGRYAKRFDYHRGMLWLQDVPDFEWIYIHVGNLADHTSGCILVGQNCRLKPHMAVLQSADAYRDLYALVIDAAEAGELQVGIVDDD